MPFLWGEVLELEREGLEYTLKDKTVYLQFAIGGGAWSLVFEISPKTK